MLPIIRRISARRSHSTTSCLLSTSALQRWTAIRAVREDRSEKAISSTTAATLQSMAHVAGTTAEEEAENRMETISDIRRAIWGGASICEPA